MKWPTLLQIILITIVLIFAISYLLLINKNRYEFIPSVNDYAEIKLENGEVRFIPTSHQVVFDKMTGKIYQETKYIKPAAVKVDDYINRKSELYPLDVKTYANFTVEWDTVTNLLKEREKEEALKLYRTIK